MDVAMLPGLVPNPGMQPSWMHPEGSMMHGYPNMMPQMQLQLMPDGSIVQIPVAPLPPTVPQPRWLDENGLMVYQIEPLKVCVGFCDPTVFLFFLPSHALALRWTRSGHGAVMIRTRTPPAPSDNCPP